MGSATDSFRLSNPPSLIQNRLEDLKTQCISNPGNAEKILSGALEQLCTAIKWLTTLPWGGGMVQWIKREERENAW